MKIRPLTLEECIQLNLCIQKALKSLRVEVDNFRKKPISEQYDLVWNALPHVVPMNAAHENIHRLISLQDENVKHHVLTYLHTLETKSSTKSDT